VINGGRPFAVMGFMVARGRIVEIDAVLGAERMARFDFSVIDDEPQIAASKLDSESPN
jgi:hypothetical protein